ncbi:MAG: phosphate acetyltransferase [Clostridiales bacterium]|nr:phosphate acetyltransferase [Clostridiales bacterium]
MSQTSLIQILTDKVKNTHKRVGLPECDSAKTLLAARRLLDEQIAVPVLINIPSVIEDTAAAAAVSLDGMEIVDISTVGMRDHLISEYLKYNNIFSEKSCIRKAGNPMNYAMMLEAVGELDAVFCGHTNTTADVLMAASSLIGLKDEIDVPSIAALVEIPGFDGSEGSHLIFSDCGLNPEPSAEEMASIAINAADLAAGLMGWDPRVAFLSYSTKGSGAGDSIDRINEAIQIVKKRRPELKADGEFQLDTAILPHTAEKKLKEPSSVAGVANILIFPELGSANIAIKAVQIFAHGNGYGHTLSGFRRPVADSSRNASVDEMVGDIVMLLLAGQ